MTKRHLKKIKDYIKYLIKCKEQNYKINMEFSFELQLKNEIELECLICGNKIKKLYQDFLKLKYKCKSCFNNKQLEEIKKIIKNKNGVLVSNKYEGTEEKLDVYCKNNHMFKITLSHLREGRWCPSCARRNAVTYEVIKKLIESKGGILLTKKEEYISSIYTLEVKCSKCNKIWFPLYAGIKGGSWCFHCAREKQGDKKRMDIKEIRNLATKKEGKLLSKNYKNNEQKLIWECKEGHIFKAKVKHVKNSKSWCPFCAKNLPITYEKCKIFVEEKNCTLLTLKEDFINSKSRIKIQCNDCKEICEISYKNARDQKGLCRKCYDINKKLSLEECQKLAKAKGGKCLSNEYINYYTEMLWECKENHIWESSLNNIKGSDTWCPVCWTKNSKGERLVRKTFEEIFKVKFIKVKPEWLRRLKNRNLELDGYNEELKLAFEHQGQQHYRYIEFFHKTKKDFENQQKRDQFKRDKCKEKGITLIEIPELFSLTDPKKLKDLILFECKKNNIFPPKPKRKFMF